MEIWSPFVSRCCECVAFVLLGCNLRNSGLFKSSDGQAVVTLASFTTIPAVILQNLSKQGPISSADWSAPIISSICMMTATAAIWLSCNDRSARERAIISGSCTGSAATLSAYPLAQTLLGAPAMLPLILADMVNAVAVHLGSYLLCASCGPAFPSSYVHNNGGTYRGQWRGMKKQGLGVYSYPGGSRYEGEWRDGLKDGRGVYFYPEGGIYEGEWLNGTMCGMGVRTYSTGRVVSGRWMGGKLVEEADVSQCVNAVEGAVEAAEGARRVLVGGGTWKEGCVALLLYPPFWAALIGVGLSLSRTSLPPSIDAATAVLAPANGPLMLMAYGLTLKIVLPPPQMVPLISHVLAIRSVIPLLMAAAVLVSTAGTRSTLKTAVLSALMVLLAPVSPMATKFVRDFRLNETLAEQVATASQLCSWPLFMGLLVLAAAPIPASVTGLCLLGLSAACGATYMALGHSPEGPGPLGSDSQGTRGALTGVLNMGTGSTAVASSGIDKSMNAAKMGLQRSGQVDERDGSRGQDEGGSRSSSVTSEGDILSTSEAAAKLASSESRTNTSGNAREPSHRDAIISDSNQPNNESEYLSKGQGPPSSSIDGGGTGSHPTSAVSHSHSVVDHVPVLGHNLFACRTLPGRHVLRYTRKNLHTTMSRHKPLQRTGFC